MNALLKNLVKLLVPETLLSFARKYKSDKKMTTWTKYKLVNRNVDGAKLIANRNELLKHLPKNGVVAELGVDKGLFSQQIIDACNPKKLHLIDIWSSKRFNETKALGVAEKFKDKIDDGSVVINRKISTEVVNDFQNKYFDWIYIDTDHSYENTLAELKSYAKKIKENGFIAGHDYVMGNWLSGTKFGVIEAVCEFCVTEKWKLVYITADYTENPSFVIQRID